jgi:hypothetical protein
MVDPPHVIYGLSKYHTTFDPWPIFQGQKHENMTAKIQ